MARKKADFYINKSTKEKVQYVRKDDKRNEIIVKVKKYDIFSARLVNSLYLPLILICLLISQHLLLI